LIPNSSTPPKHPRSIWKPIGLTLVATALLALTTCAGGFELGKAPNSIGPYLLYAGLFFVALFFLTLLFAAIYFIVWLVQKSRPQ
jgi:hypothetical protein